MISLSALLVISIGTSNLLTERSPALALAINPFNDEARLNTIIAGLARMEADRDADQRGLTSNREPGSAADGVCDRESPEPGCTPERAHPKRGKLPELLRWQVAFAPADARSYSLLGESHFQSGDAPGAFLLFEKALHHAQTEIHALQRSFEMLAREGRFSEAMDRIDILSRRWPERFPAIAPHIATMLQVPEGYDKALELLRGSPPWAAGFFRALSADEQGLAFAYRLQIDLSRQDGQSLPLEAENTMHALIRARQYALAHRLFLFTQTEADRALGAYVFNGNFLAEPGRRPFDWQIRNNASAETYWTGDGTEEGGQVRIRFLGKPVKTVGISQLAYLPRGKYSLELEYSAAGLDMPRGLFLRVRCLRPRRNSAEIGFPDERAEHRILTVQFEVGPDDCEMHRIGLDTNLIAESFRYAYRGTLTLHSIRIERIET